MADEFDQRLEHDLDTWWDAAMAGLEPLANTAPLRADIDTARYVAARHKGLPPSPTFARVLKEDLMNRVAIPNGVVELPIVDGSGNGNASVSARVQQAFWPAQRGRLRGLIELAAVAALVLLFVGIGFGDGPFGGLNSLLPNSDEQTSDSGAVGMYRGNAARTGVAAVPGPTGLPALKWQANVGPDWAMPGAAGAGDRVYLTSGELGDVSAFDVRTGGILWRATVGRLWATSPAIGNGLVYVATAGPEAGGSDAGYLIALEAETGRERWRYETGGSGNTSPAIDGDTVYVTATDQTLRAVDSLTGRERWRFDFSSASSATPGPGTPVPAVGDDWSVASVAVANGLAYVANTNEVIAVESQHGRERWRLDVDAEAIFTPAIEKDLMVFTVTNASSGLVVAVDARTGKELWTVESMKGELSGSAPAMADGLVFLPGNDGTPEGDVFTALDASNGETVWTYQTDHVNSDLTYANGVVYGASYDGRVYALDAKTGTEIWRVDTGNSTLREPVVVDGLVIVPSNLGDVYAIGEAQPGGTPIPNNGALVDVSGLPPCEPPREVSPDQLTGTPAATLLPQQSNQFTPQMKFDQVPQGEPPSGEAFAGILETLRGMAACSRPSDATALQGYFTDDFFRRDWVTELANRQPEFVAAWPISGPTGGPATSINDARLLPDGRVGVVIMDSEKFGTYVVFVEQDGHWLVDERYQLGDEIGRG